MSLLGETLLGKGRVAADDDPLDGCGQLASLLAQVVGLFLADRRIFLFSWYLMDYSS